MKTTDLRLGNFISINFGNCDDGKIITVDGVSDCEIYNEEHGYSPCNEFNPIPLTEQWLLDLGFNQNIETQWYIHFDNMCLTLYEDLPQYIVEIHDMEMDKSSIFLMSIQYVHQLQNLFFALTQEELILKERSEEL